MKLITLLFIILLSTTVARCQSGAELMTMGNAQFLRGNYTLALPYFTQATQGNTNTPKANYMTGLCNYNLGSYALANTYFTNELIIDSTCAQAYYFRSLIAKNNIDSALQNINKAISLQPNNISYLTTKAQLYYVHQQYYNSITWYQKALTINSRIDEAYYYVGYSYYYLGKQAKACNNWEKIVELDDFDNQEFIINNCKTTIK